MSFRVRVRVSVRVRVRFKVRGRVKTYGHSSYLAPGSAPAADSSSACEG